MQTSNNTSAPSRPLDGDPAGRISSGSTAADSDRPRRENRGPSGLRKHFGTERSRKRLESFRNKMREAWRAFIRAFSLSLLAHALRGLRYPIGRGLHEPTKIALNQSRIVVFVRCLIHVIPFGFALFEIILNWNVYYVGTQPYGTAVYQIIAKAHEILIQASVTTIIFSAIRRELAYGKGLPFGFLFSGLQITQISYLWSMELWGAIKADSIDLWRRIGVLTLLTGSILLAATCGPASAVLLIPRLQQWPAGSTRIWVNATADQIWPSRVDGSTIPRSCATIGTDSSNACPASEWYAIRDFFSALGPRYPRSPNRFTISLESCLVHGQRSARELSSGKMGSLGTAGPAISTATSQQAVVSDALSATGAIWFWSLTNVTAKSGHGSPLSDQSNGIHRIASNYRQPSSEATCIPFIVGNSTGSRLVAFPVLPFGDLSDAAAQNLTSRILPTGHYSVIEHPELIYSQILDAPGDVKGYRLEWVELPRDLFDISSIGVVILLPKHPSTNLQRGLVCNIAAGWGASELAVETTGSGIGTVKDIAHPQNIRDKGPPRPISETHIPRAQGVVGSATLRPIAISESWARYLNPFIEKSNTTLFNILMQQTDLTDPENFLDSGFEIISSALVMLTANGLARTSWGSAIQGTVKTKRPGEEGLADGDYWLSGKGDVFEVDPVKSKNWTSFRVESSLEGYAYNTLTASPKIAIAIMMVYCLLVLGHTIYSGITGISSNCWDTIAEVTALAINSTPTAALRNTCAGISELHIFKLPVRILVSRDEEGEGEHLELVFGQVDEAKMKERTIKPNTTYGTLPRGCIGEGKKDV